MSGDRFNIASQMEHLQMKYTGTGHADTTKMEWMVSQHRDSYTSYVGNPALLAYFTIAQNQSQGRVKYEMMQKMAKPCGDDNKKEAEPAEAKENNQ